MIEHPEMSAGHTELLNRMLSNACPNTGPDEREDGCQIFEIDLCCAAAVITAKLLGPYNDYYKYEIKEFKIT